MTALSFYFKSTLKYLFSFSILLPVSAAAVNLDSLLIKSVGGHEAVKKIKSLKSYIQIGRINWNGLEGTYEAHVKFPDKVKVTADFGDFSIVQGFDGTNAWQKDIHGRFVKLSGFEKKEFLRSVYFMTFAFLLKNLGNDTSSVQNLKLESPGYMATLYPSTDDSIQIFFDSSNGQLRKTSATMDNIMVNTDLSDFRSIESILFPFGITSTGENTPMLTEVDIDTIMLNLELLESDFFKPSIDFSDFNFPPDSHSITFPFIYRNGHVLVPVNVNGIKKGWFILDTGASATYYDSKFVLDLELKAVGQLPSMGIGGYEQIQLIRMDSLQIGKLTLYNQTAGVLPLDNLAVFAQKKTAFGGILGYDFFMNFPVLFDFKKQILSIFNPAEYTIPEKGIAQPIHFTLMIPTINSQIGGVSGDFLIDLGNALGLIIHHKFGETLIAKGIIDTTGLSTRPISGIGPGVLGRTVSIANMQIDAHNITVPEAVLAESSAGLTGSWEIAGNIGTKILEQYAVLFDYPQSRIVFYELEN
jgi:hypothetical protein